MATTIKMFRKEDGKSADVHPDMVDDYAGAGFEPVDEKPKAKRKKAAEK